MGTKVAETVAFPFSHTRHEEPVPLQAPPQFEKTYPMAGLAVRVTLLAPLNDPEQVAPQLIPAGELDTIPDPLSETPRLYIGTSEKLAVTVTS